MIPQDGKPKIQTQVGSEPSQSRQVVVTKEDLMETLRHFIASMGITRTENVEELSTFDQQTISSKAFDAVQRWIDFSGRNQICLDVSTDSDWAVLFPYYLHQRMKLELSGDILTIFYRPVSDRRVDNNINKAKMKFLTLLVLQMLRALPSGRCGRGVLIEKELDIMTDSGWTMESRLKSALHTISWLVLELGPGIVFFIDGGMDTVPKDLAEELLRIILGPKDGNKIWLNFRGEGDWASSYQELFWENNQLGARSFEFDLSPSSANAPQRRIAELTVQVPQRTPHPVEFAKIEGAQGKVRKGIEQLKKWVLFE
ncbi:hypothetical protein F5X99DRAFT_411144 [Biscogniauxia marginata]|nr:hypothetical protein F5X99DRAFT_411144 [Biscogniauxia marginata]